MQEEFLRVWRHLGKGTVWVQGRVRERMLRSRFWELWLVRRDEESNGGSSAGREEGSLRLQGARIPPMYPVGTFEVHISTSRLRTELKISKTETNGLERRTQSFSPGPRRSKRVSSLWSAASTTSAPGLSLREFCQAKNGIYLEEKNIETGIQVAGCEQESWGQGCSACGRTRCKVDKLVGT